MPHSSSCQHAPLKALSSNSMDTDVLTNGCDPDLLQGPLRKESSLDGKQGWEETEGAALKPYCDPRALEHIFWSQAKITRVGASYVSESASSIGHNIAAVHHHYRLNG